MSGERQAATVDRSLAILGAMGQGAMSFSRLAQTVSCTDAILSRLLKGLQAAELITGGHGQAYALTPRARELARAILGNNDRVAHIRQQLQQVSALSGTGCAWFMVTAEGVRCVLRHQLSEGVGFISEGRLRADLLGHGSMVAACALSDELAAQHGPGLRAYLGFNQKTWRDRLARVRALGYDLAHGQEGAPGQGDGPLPTLARLSIPYQNNKGDVFVLTATGHGLSGDQVFPAATIAELMPRYHTIIELCSIII